MSGGYMKSKLFCITLFFYAALAYADDTVFIIDGQSAGGQPELPRVEDVYTWINAAVLSGEDHVGIVQAGEQPLLIFPPALNNSFLGARIITALDSLGSSPDMDEALELAVKQLNFYGQGGGAKRIFILTAGVSSSASPARKPDVDVHVFYIGKDIEAGYKNALNRAAAHSYEIIDTRSLQQAMGELLLNISPGYRETARYSIDKSDYTTTITLGDWFHIVDSVLVCIENLPVNPVNALTVDSVGLDSKNSSDFLNDRGFAAFSPVSAGTSLIKINNPRNGKHTISFPLGTEITGVRIYQKLRLNIVVSAVMVLFVLLILFFVILLLHSLFKPVFLVKLTLPEIDDHLPLLNCRVSRIARNQKNRVYPAGFSVGQLMQDYSIDGEWDLGALKKYVICYKKGKWMFSHPQVFPNPEETEIVEKIIEQKIGVSLIYNINIEHPGNIGMEINKVKK